MPVERAIHRIVIAAMNANAKESTALAGIAVLMAGLAVSFVLDLWAKPNPRMTVPPTPPEATNTATVRLSAAELFRTGGDTSGLACSSCHDEGKPVEVKFDTNGVVILAEAHKDLVFRHGQANRNDHCFNCHDPKNLEQLRSRDGKVFKITESSAQCGSCHGPTYRDWERGLHGRSNGSWDRKRGTTLRQDCTACHDPHSPAFPAMKAAPEPYRGVISSNSQPSSTHTH